MKNQEVALKFINGIDAKGSNLESRNGVLYSYTSILAKWQNGVIVVDSHIANYSMTSKKHWYHLRTQAPNKLLVIKD
jgi:hypothetical protein